MSNARSPGNNNLGLPKVGPGDALTPSVINKLSDRVNKLSPSIGAGSNVQNTPTGSFQVSSKRPIPGHPWKMSFNGTQIYIDVGQFFANRVGGGGVNIVTAASEYLGGSRNAWLFQTYEAGGPTWQDANAKDLFYMGGCEILFEDPDSNVISNKQLYVSTDGLRTKRKKGLFYIEMAAWNGRQMQQPYPQPGGSKQMAAANAAAQQWNAYSLTMKGRIVPIFKHAPPLKATIGGVEYPGMYDIKQFVYPIATVTKNWQLFQGVSSDIFHVSPPLKPFEVSVTKEGSVWKVAVHPGTVNQIVPKISGKYLDEYPSPLLTVNGAGRILLKATHQANKWFPRDVEVVFESGQTVPEDTETVGYYQIASVAVVSSNYVVTQLTTGNKLVNRFKMGAAGAYWAWGS
jgi:hypothetical protein